MSEIAGAPASDVPVAPAPGAQPVNAPAAPTGQEEAPPNGESVKTPRTYSEEEHRKGISDRLAKEKRRVERTVRAEMERDFYKQQLEQSRTTPQPGADKPTARPLMKDYDNPEEWAQALSDWNYDRREAAKAKEAQEKGRKQETDSRDSARAQTIRDFIEASSESHPEFQEVALADNLAITEPMMHAAMESERGAEALIYLGRNPKEAKRIAELKPTRQVIEFDKIVAKISAPPTPTKTPQPITPSGGNASSGKDWSGMSTKDHVEAWAKRKNR